MGATVLRLSDGEHRAIKKGSSCDLVLVLTDTEDNELATAAILVLTCSHYVAGTGTVINQRAEGGSKHNILNTNEGTVEDTLDGTAELVLKFGPADTVIEDAANKIGPGDYETHYVFIEWEWIDDDGVRRYGSEEFEIYIEERTTPVLAA